MRKILLILCAVVGSMLCASAQQTTAKSKDSKSETLAAMYRSEVNIGFAVTGAYTKAEISIPGVGGDYGTDVGSLYANGRASSGDRVHSVFSRPFVETIHGLQLFKYLFVGAGVGFQYYCGKLHDFQSYADIAATIKNKSKSAKRWNALMMPIFVDVKGFYPIKEDLIPFINLGLGGTASFCSAINFKFEEVGYASNVKMRGGFYCDFGGGVRLKQFNFSIGLQHQTVKVVSKESTPATEFVPSSDVQTTLRIKTNAFYLKAGYCF